MMENHAYSGIIGNAAAPYINALAATGALFTDSHAISHPSLPNYLAIFSGSTQGVTDDGCSYLFSGPNLASELIAHGYTFGGYAENLPSSGGRSCNTGLYGQRHVPEAYFTNTPPVVNYAGSLPGIMPTVMFLTPNICDDMHDCSVAHGDAWLASNVPQILAYDALHNGLLILTWDEDDHYSGNHVATIFVGPMVTAGTFSQSIDHYSVLRTITDNYGLPVLNSTSGISGVWH